MQTFLERSAQHIYSQHTHAQLSKVCVVLPSRRAYVVHKYEVLNVQEMFAFWRIVELFKNYLTKLKTKNINSKILSRVIYLSSICLCK